MLPFEHTGEQWLNYLRAWTIIGIVDISAQTLFQRVASAESERVAQNSFYIGSIGYLFFGMIPVLLGIIGITIADTLLHWSLNIVGAGVSTCAPVVIE